jgi:NodT family efflux transporter outer membrane factor (OMF) lipoprotein
LPDYWAADPNSKPVDANTLENWWKSFNDNVLTSLIERADACSPDITAALARIDESRALRDFAGGQYFPTVDAAASYTRTRPSTAGLGIIASPGEQSLYAAGFDAFWEIDLFGRVRRAVESAQAALEQSIADYHDIRITLYAEVARNYIELRTAQSRIRYAQANIDIQRKTLGLTQDRFAAEIAPQLDVAQARLNLANTESEIPTLRIAETAALNRLAVLIGTTSHDLRAQLSVPADLPLIEAPVTTGLPAELLRRRPDIRAAERALAAQTALVGLAEAARYPFFSLRGAFTMQGLQFADLGDWSSRSYAFGPQASWTIFDFDRLRNLVAAESARTQQLAAAYHSTLLLALTDVENAMVGYEQEQQRTGALKQSVDAAQQSVEMVEMLYRSGLTDFQNVLDSQRSLFIQQDRLAISEGLFLEQVISLYKALGGGWDQEQKGEELNGML